MGIFSLQVPSAAKLVHAAVMDPENKAMEACGGESFHPAFLRTSGQEMPDVAGGA